jgi:hypothetical protein
MATGGELAARAGESALTPGRKELRRENLRQRPAGEAVNSAVAGWGPKGPKRCRKGAELRPDAPHSGQKGPICARYFGGKARCFPRVLGISAENARHGATQNAIFRAAAAAQFTRWGPMVGRSPTTFAFCIQYSVLSASPRLPFTASWRRGTQYRMENRLGQRLKPEGRDL